MHIHACCQWITLLFFCSGFTIHIHASTTTTKTLYLIHPTYILYSIYMILGFLFSGCTHKLYSLSYIYPTYTVSIHASCRLRYRNCSYASLIRVTFAMQQHVNDAYASNPSIHTFAKLILILNEWCAYIPLVYCLCQFSSYTQHIVYCCYSFTCYNRTLLSRTLK